MSFIGDTLGSIVNPILGKPDPEAQENATNVSSALAQQAAGMSFDYYTKTAPLRGAALNRLTNFMEGNFDPTASAMYGPIKMTAERQYDTARGNVMSQLPQGGALFESLANLEGQKAESITDQIARIVQDEYNKAYAMGQGSPQVAAAGITSNADTMAKLNSSLAQQQSAGAQGTGNAVSLIAALLKYLE